MPLSQQPAQTTADGRQEPQPLYRIFSVSLPALSPQTYSGQTLFSSDAEIPMCWQTYRRYRSGRTARKVLPVSFYSPISLYRYPFFPVCGFRSPPHNLYRCFPSYFFPVHPALPQSFSPRRSRGYRGPPPTLQQAPGYQPLPPIPLSFPPALSIRTTA